MSNPTIVNLYGPGSTWLAANASVTEPGLFIPASALNTVQLSTATTPSAVEIAGAVDQLNNNWLKDNTETAVPMTSDASAIAPANRNGTVRTQFQFTRRHYRSYSAPAFIPNLDS